MSTPQLQLETLFVLDQHGRIVSTREPGASRGPMFMLIRSATHCAWAVRSDADAALFQELDRLARQESPMAEFQAEPLHSHKYRALVGGSVEFGPAFSFPQELPRDDHTEEILSENNLGPHFPGWIAGEIEAGRSPVISITEGGSPVSICFCARRSSVAAEAGLETAAEFRGRGFGPRVTAAWATATTALGLVPLYSTSWNNKASLAVARKLALIPYASDWSIAGDP